MRALSVVMFGGTGFIGSHLAARLAEHDVAIVCPRPGTKRMPCT
jgi:nucleoside-diphosphate-sugar epimerase